MTCDNKNEMFVHEEGENQKKDIPAYKSILKNYKYLNYMMVNQLEFMSTHRGLTGSYREKMWLSFFRSIIPQKYSLAQGVIIIDSYGNQSKEVDIAVFDEQYTPYVFQFDSIKFIPIEAVAVVISCKSGEVKKNNEICWAESIDQLRPIRAGITRTISGLSIGYTNESQIRTRPIKILATMSEHFYSSTMENFRDRYEKYYDFVILEKKSKLQKTDSNKKKYGDNDQLEQEETTKNSDDILKKFEVLLSHPTWSLGAWYRALNQFSGKFEEPVEDDSTYDLSISNGVWINVKQINDGLLVTNIKDDSSTGEEKAVHNSEKMSDSNIKLQLEQIRSNENNSYIKIKNTLEDLKIEGYPLLTLNLQLNQLLMLINNPMLFPHYAYAERFREVARRGTNDE